jgi:hypothetical protein
MPKTIYDKPTRVLLKEMLGSWKLQPGETFNAKRAVDWFAEKYPKLKSGSINAHLVQASTSSMYKMTAPSCAAHAVRNSEASMKDALSGMAQDGNTNRARVPDTGLLSISGRPSIISTSWRVKVKPILQPSVVDREAFRLNARDVKYVIDQAQQMTACMHYQPDSFGLARRQDLDRVRRKQLREAKHCVQRCPKLMTHLRQEVGLGTVGVFGRHPRAVGQQRRMTLPLAVRVVQSERQVGTELGQKRCHLTIEDELGSRKQQQDSDQGAAALQRNCSQRIEAGSEARRTHLFQPGIRRRVIDDDEFAHIQRQRRHQRLRARPVQQLLRRHGVQSGFGSRTMRFTEVRHPDNGVVHVARLDAHLANPFEQFRGVGTPEYEAIGLGHDRMEVVQLECR